MYEYLRCARDAALPKQYALNLNKRFKAQIDLMLKITPYSSSKTMFGLKLTSSIRILDGEPLFAVTKFL